MSQEIHPVRHAARQLIRELQLLDGRVGCCGLTVSECHLITELSQRGEATASELGELLVLEKSTMSRLVNKLVKKGLVCSRCCEDDRRARMLCLTEKGKKEAARVDDYANAQVTAALSFVSTGEEDEVYRGLDRYARSLRYARLSEEFDIRPIRREDNAAVANIIRDVMTEFGAVGKGYSIEDPEVDSMYEAYPAPHSVFYVVERNGEILGCGGMGPLEGGDEDVCELRKMYFRPELRGTGMGSKLLRQILEAARSAGFRLCYLETLGSMESARRLYRKHGFTDQKGPLGNTGHSGCNQYMTLTL